jgi:ribonuclease P protein component
VGNAVARNRAKRRLRALFIENCNKLKNGTYIFVAKNGIDKIEFDIVKRDFLYTLKKLNLLDKK